MSRDKRKKRSPRKQVWKKRTLPLTRTSQSVDTSTPTSYGRYDFVRTGLEDIIMKAQTLLEDLKRERLVEVAKLSDLTRPMLPDRIVTPKRQISNIDKKTKEKFLLWRDDPVVETAVDPERNELRIVAVMPGVSKEDIELEVTKNSLILRTAENGPGAAAVAIPFYVPVKARSIETSFKNGILEARLKLEPSNENFRVRIK